MSLMSLRFTSTCGRGEKVERVVSGEGTSSGLGELGEPRMDSTTKYFPNSSGFAHPTPGTENPATHSWGSVKPLGCAPRGGRQSPNQMFSTFTSWHQTGTKSPTTAGGEGKQGRTPNKLKKLTEMHLATKGMSSESRSLQACSLLFLRDKPRASFQLKKKN